ncbi:MAG TPA: hypothetical protein VD947_03815 [Patescibacteria group bacterium]|nr:hypothetical protein [Patescibacteria group bacterium]
MSKTISNIDKFHNTKKGKLIFGTIELILAYVIVSRAIDTGSLWQYLAFIILFIGGLNNLIRAVIPAKAKSNAKGKSKKR